MLEKKSPVQRKLMSVQTESTADRSSLTRYAWLSIGAAVTTIVMKTAAYLLTGSVSLLSDAVESTVNLLGAIMALLMLTVAARPADASHTFGHSKAEYFSSMFEGFLILVAAAAIAYAAVGRILHPQPLEQMGIGLLVSAAASAVNFVVARILMRAGQKNNSITLEADAQHLMTDVWTSVGVIGGLVLVTITGWNILDPLMALLVAANIIRTGFGLVRRSVNGLMDAALPESEQQAVEKVMAKYKARNVQFHALRTRQSASRRFMSVHLLVPGDWTVHDAHHVAEDFASDIRAALGNAEVVTHLEPLEDELSMQDIELE
jgi:cation diffusion facilitator family transporter